MGTRFNSRLLGRCGARIAESGKRVVWSPEASIERGGMRIVRAGEILPDRRRVDRRDIVGFRKGIGQHFPFRIEMLLEIELRIRMFPRNPGKPRSEVSKEFLQADFGLLLVVEEYPAFPHIGGDRHEAACLLVEIEEVRLVWHAHQAAVVAVDPVVVIRSEEHTSELQSLMRISYAVFCLNTKNHTN